jgi:hypothetical protein
MPKSGQLYGHSATDLPGALSHSAVAKTLPPPEEPDACRGVEQAPLNRGHLVGSQKRVVTPCACNYCQGKDIPEVKRARTSISETWNGYKNTRVEDIKDETVKLLQAERDATADGRPASSTEEILDLGSEDELEVGCLASPSQLSGGHAQNLEEERVRLYNRECCNRARIRAKDLDQLRQDFQSRVVENPRIAVSLCSPTNPHQIYGGLPGYGQDSKGEAISRLWGS